MEKPLRHRRAIVAVSRTGLSLACDPSRASRYCKNQWLMYVYVCITTRYQRQYIHARRERPRLRPLPAIYILSFILLAVRKCRWIRCHGLLVIWPRVFPPIKQQGRWLIDIGDGDGAKPAVTRPWPTTSRSQVGRFPN
ncbi:hypothetical protein BJX96DRAFT_116713 [Aspergillus floccosus]